MTGQQTIEESFRHLESFLSDLRQNVEHHVTTETMIERQLQLNKDMAQNWLKRREESVLNADDKMVKLAIRQQDHHENVACTFENELETARKRTAGATMLVNELVQFVERLRVLQLLLSPIPELDKKYARNFGSLVEHLREYFFLRMEEPESEPFPVSQLEDRLDKLEGETVIDYDNVPADRLGQIVDRVNEEKTHIEEDRRRNQQMLETWQSRVEMAAELGEAALTEPAEARKRTYQFRVTHIDKSLKLVSAISSMLEKKLART